MSSEQNDDKKLNEKTGIIQENRESLKNTGSQQELKMMFQRIFDSNDGFDLTERQIDEALSQRREVNSYIHKERMQKHTRFEMSSKYQIYYFLAILVFSGIVMFYKPEYFTEVLYALFGFLGGYGLGRHKAREESE